jgi:hypothetical protein
LKPLIDAPTTTTDETPIMMPISVRNARIFCAKIERSAIRAASAKKEYTCLMSALGSITVRAAEKFREKLKFVHS